MATKEQLIEANKKAVLSPDIGKRGKAKKTIAREEARMFYELQGLEKLGKITKVQMEAALKIENVTERMYVINQLIGKAVEKLDITSQGRRIGQSLGDIELDELVERLNDNRRKNPKVEGDDDRPKSGGGQN